METIRADVKSFVNKCLHCLVANGHKCPRPYGETLNATKPTKFLHFDFLPMPKGLQGYMYVLVLKYDMSGFCESVTTTVANTEVTVQALMNRFKRYGFVFLEVLVQGSHFKMQLLFYFENLGAQHHFVTAYCPWANGTVDVMNRQLSKVMRSLLSEQRQRTVN